MKTSLHASTEIKAQIQAFLKPQGGRTSGMVLIIVLCCVVLLTILIVGFLGSSATEITASKQFSSSADAQNLASSALNFVMSQVADATSGSVAGADPSDLSQRLSWASQPGMIRTYTTSPGNVFGTCYKLYSSSKMQVPGADFNNSNAINQETPPTNWNQAQAIYTDLNAPVGTQTSPRFPIVDPRADARIAGTSSGVEGFTYDETFTGAKLPADSASADSARLPMPVQWLYVLNDGRFVAPAGTGAVATVAGASKTNPIVGRIAFWTDDESCKVNINTASEGVFWDTPVAFLGFEVKGLDQYWPSQGEYQRYPGHPATTSLSAVFPALKGPAPSGGASPIPRNDKYYDITPRIKQGGSYEGTTFAPLSLFPENDRLYDTVDELAFTAEDVNGNPARVLRTSITPADIERRRFFLTTQSRSPEVTLFNTPRVAIWPLFPEGPSANPSARHASEKLIAFASTAGPVNDITKRKEYFFTRLQPSPDAGETNYDPATDFKDSSPESMSEGRAGRNVGIYRYLQQLTSAPIPGYGASFIQKWGALQRDQILTEIFDYIRSGPNLTSSLNPAGKKYTNRYYSGDNAMVIPTIIGSGVGAGTRGFGRYFTAEEFALQFGRMEVTHTAPGPNGTTAIVKDTYLDGSQKKATWCAFIIEMILTSPGLKTFNNNAAVTVSGLDSFRWNYQNQEPGQPVSWSGPVAMWPATPLTFYAKNSFGIDRFSASHIGYYMLYQPGSDPNRTLPGHAYSDAACPPTLMAGSNFQFLGGTAVVKIAPYEAAGMIGAQTFTITFPPIPLVAMPVVFPDVDKLDPGIAWNGEQYINFNTFRTRMSSGGNAPKNDGIFSGDVVKSMVNRHGDARLIAAKEQIYGGGQEFPDNKTNPNDFVPHKNYYSSNPAGANTLMSGDTYLTPYYSVGLGIVGWDSFVNDSLGEYVAGLRTYWANLSGTVNPLPYAAEFAGLTTWPKIRKRSDGSSEIPTNSLGQPGDWDNGPGSIIDGPWINKVDEGLDLYEGYQTSAQASRYFWAPNWDNVPLEQFFSPMRQMASPVMFGSLPAGTKDNRPWETLLFCPNPASGSTWVPNSSGELVEAGQQHPGFASPPDHLMLDFFWMPATEPWPISENFSTAGQINLNTQILPFTYITRDTGMRAALAGTRITALDNSMAPYHKYKGNTSTGNTLAKADWIRNMAPDLPSRYKIDATQTLRQSQERFSNGKIFKSATEICEMFLVPGAGVLANGESPNAYTLEQVRGSTFFPGNMAPGTFWSTHGLTGDNSREKPYNSLYPRLTTRSNVYTVYVKAQALKQTKSTLESAASTFTEGKDVVQSEFQASYTFERYLDPNAPASANDTDILGPYKMRVINQRNLSW